MIRVQVKGLGVVEFPDGTSEDAMQRALSDSTQVMPRVVGTPALDVARSKIGRAMPTVLGLAGGLAGSPFGPGPAIGAAGLGGMVGRGVEAAIAGQPPESGEIAQAGLRQMVAEGAGRGLSAGLGLAARPVMRGALRANKAIQQSFPHPERTMLEERLTVGQIPALGGGGLKTAAAARRGATADSKSLIAKAEEEGRRFNVADLSRSAIDEAEKAIGRVLTRNERNDLLARVRHSANEVLAARTHGVVRRMRNVFTPSEVDMIRQEMQHAVRSYYNAVRAGTVGPSAAPTLERAIAASAREAVGSIRGRVAGKSTTVEALRQREQSLIGATRAISDAEARHPPTFVPFVAGLGGYGVTGDPMRAIGMGLAAREFLSPWMQSRIALGMTNPAVREATRQLPRAADYFMNEDEP